MKEHKVKHWSFLFIFAALFCVQMAAVADVDPYYLNSPSCIIDRGNPARTGEYLTEPVVKFHGVVWNNEVGGTTILACYKNSIIVNGPAVLRIKDGEKIWGYDRQDNTVYLSSTATVYQDILYAVANTEIGTKFSKLVGYEGNTGKELIQIEDATNTQFAAFNPIPYNGIVYFNLSTSIVAYELNTKKMIWRFNTSTPASPISTDGERIYFGDWYKNIYALDMHTGKMIWSISGIAAGGNYISIYQGKVYVYSDKLYCIEAKTGRVIWEHAMASKYGDSVAVSDGIVYVSNVIDHSLHAISAEEGKELWKNNCKPTSSPTIAGKTIYIVSLDKLFAIDKKTGKTLSQIQIPGREDGLDQAWPTALYIMPYNKMVFLMGINMNVMAIY